MMNIDVLVNNILDRLTNYISHIKANNNAQGGSLSKIIYYVNWASESLF